MGNLALSALHRGEHDERHTDAEDDYENDENDYSAGDS
jgi:hypothetical protein